MPWLAAATAGVALAFSACSFGGAWGGSEEAPCSADVTIRWPCTLALWTRSASGPCDVHDFGSGAGGLFIEGTDAGTCTLDLGFSNGLRYSASIALELATGGHECTYYSPSSGLQEIDVGFPPCGDAGCPACGCIDPEDGGLSRIFVEAGNEPPSDCRAVTLDGSHEGGDG